MVVLVPPGGPGRQQPLAAVTSAAFIRCFPDFSLIREFRSSFRRIVSLFGWAGNFIGKCLI
jgi:hypothetical protein